MAEKSDSATNLCEQCGAPFQSKAPGGHQKRFCTSQCRNTAKERRRGKKQRIQRSGPCSVPGCNGDAGALGLCTKHYQAMRAHGSTDPTFRCQHCAKEFSGRSRKFCGAECRSAAIYERLGKPKRRWVSRMPPTRCKECGVEFPTRSGRTESGLKEYCSKQCANAEKSRIASSQRILQRHQAREATRQKVEAQRRRRRDEREISDLLRLLRHQCSECSAPLRSFRNKLCHECRDQRASAQKRAARAARKALQRSVTVERFDPLEVLRRDGWKCHLCGCKTPEKYRGTYRDDAPEIDHIIPLAAGGEHSRRNTACACRRCNIAKADKPMGQLRLVA